jgi:hypothetical protein
MAALAHFSFGFAAKRVAPKVPVGFMLAACGLLDFAAMGISAVWGSAGNPGVYWTHSLVMAAAWTVVVAGATALISRNARAALVMGALVFLHWVVDAITWPMTAAYPAAGTAVPIAFSETPSIGLGLYRTVSGVILGEGVMFAAGLALYVLTLVRLRREKRKVAGVRA